MRVLFTALIVAAIVAAPWMGPHTRVVAADAPGRVFSGARALPIVNELAREPRPMGSEAHARALALVHREITKLGLESLEHVRPLGHVPGGRLVNVLARVPGSDSTGVVLLMTHYDSREGSPGAGDDASGVAAAFEALRALLARGVPRNDVVLLVTDGEERGLLGARAFGAEHEWAQEVRLVVNLDAIGNAGPAALFETGEQNGAVVRAIAEHVDAPVGGSFATAVYRSMPNDTDYSVFRARGVPGANIALTGNGRAYHSVLDTPENFDPRGLQHMGDVALAMLGAFAAMDLAEAEQPMRRFIPLPGGAVLHFPASWARPFAWFVGVVLLLAAAVSSRRASRLPGATPAHAVQAIVLVVALAILGAALAAGAVASGLFAFGGWSEPPSPTRAWQVHVRLFFAVALAFTAHGAVCAWLARGERGRAMLAQVPAVMAIAWVMALVGLGRFLGDDALPLVALCAVPVVFTALLAHRRVVAVFVLLGVALAAQTLQGIYHVSTTSPKQEVQLAAILVALGTLLVATWPARMAPTPES